MVGGTRFGTNWWIASDYGAAEHGPFAVVFQLISMVVVFGELGIASTYGVRRIAAARGASGDDLDRLVNGLAAALLIVHGAALLLLLAACVPLAYTGVVPVGLLIPASFWLIGFGFYRVAMMVATGLERTDAALVATLLFYGAWLAWLVTGMLRMVDVPTLVTGWAWVLPVAGVAACAAVTPRLDAAGVKWHFCPGAAVGALPMIVRAVPYGLPVTGTFVVPGIACLLLAAIADAVAVSHFQIVYSVAILAHLVAVPFATAARARWSQLHARAAGATADTGAVLAAGVRLVGAVALLAVAAHALAGRSVLGWLHADYAVHVTWLLALGAAVAVDAVRMLLDQLLLARGAVGVVVRLEPVRHVVLLGVGLWLVPAHGAVGAVAAVIASMAVNTVLKAHCARRMEGFNAWPSLGLIAGAAALAAGFGPGWPAALLASAAAVGLGWAGRRGGGWLSNRESE